MANQFAGLSREELLAVLSDFAKRWLAHDGLWFQAVEREHGMEAAIRADAAAWEQFTVNEARRIMKLHGIPENGGIPALKKALGYRLYALLNRQEIVDVDENRIIFRMNDCRVQSARKRKNLPDFPCKTVGLVEYTEFARAIDPRIKTRCVCCPPDEHPEEYYCAWEFWID
ncbi:hypothetical protein SAMN02745218_00838 [Desulfofundulus australicus DSM 11792]|jgi:hypothetical protein|uniref:Cytosolic protein n=1 Tax=Desulfofundulus australicus DSM 11792 TaxID=1121425 RepID=A0A1M4WI23_9FIRM|nr:MULTISPECIES: DUF6125 family protein [Desulfofundulus]MDK2887858.1 hypothetical protein [Thermoanaerobacter sp.]SHE80864.1 hypothetical protein SAMN02745218_00838 [Desulfofundulus australicus DSM 11792]